MGRGRRPPRRDRESFGGVVVSQVQKLESLLALVQRNRHKPRAATAPAAAPGRTRKTSPSPLEVAIGGAADEPAAPAKPQPVARATPKAQPRPAPARPAAPKTAPTPVTAPTPMRAAKPAAPTKPTPVAAAPIAAPSAPVATASSDVVVEMPKTFDELLAQSLALRPLEH